MKGSYIDPYSGSEYVPPVVPSETQPRELVAGDLLASREDWKFCGPFVFVEWDGPRMIVKSTDAKELDDTIEYVALRFVDNDGTWEGWLGPEGEHTAAVTFRDGYGPALNQWLFADDPRVTFLSDLERQLLSVRCKPGKRHGKPVTNGARPGRVPPCASCGEWPCKSHAGCPDYARLAKYGWHDAPQPQLINE